MWKTLEHLFRILAKHQFIGWSAFCQRFKNCLFKVQHYLLWEGCISRMNTTIDGMSVAFWRRKLKRECLQDVKCWASTHSTDVKRKLHEAQPFCSPWYTLLHFLSYIFLHSYSSTLFSQSTNSPGENNDAEGIGDLDNNDGDDWGQVHTENDDNCYADRYRPVLREVDIFENTHFLT